MDNNTARALCNDLNTAIADTLAKYGFAGKVASIRLDSVGFQCTIKAATVDTATVEAGKRAEFERYASMYGVPPEAFGVEFRSAGRTFRLNGLTGGRSTKYVFTAVDVSSGREYKFDRTVVAAINAAVTASRAA